MLGVDLEKPNIRVDEPFWTESCRAISVKIEEPHNEGCNYKDCNVIALGSDSEEDLYFPEEEEEETTSPRKQILQNCQMNLRGGKDLPERQPPKEKEKKRIIEIREDGIAAEPPRRATSEYNILAHLRKVPALLSIYDALMMSQELRDVLVYALQNPQKFQAYFAETNMKEALYAMHTETITFGHEDLLLGTTQHNRPLYMTGSHAGMKIDRILIDPGSSVNLLTLKTLRNLSLSVNNLNAEKIIIQGFNQHSQKALGAITLTLQFGDLCSEVKFYVISADPSYKALLGRPWLHQNNVVPSTLHQCLKYLDDGVEKRIDGDIQPFGVHEIKYEDARYYQETKSRTVTAPKFIPPNESIMQKSIKEEKEKGDTSNPTIPHFGSDSDTEDEAAFATYHVNRARNQSTIQNNHQDDDSYSEKVEFSIISLRQDLEVSESILSITKIPNGLYKELNTLEVHKVQELKTFYVPHKVERIRGKKSTQRYILFHRCDSALAPNEETILHPEQEEVVEIEPLQHFSHHTQKLVEKMNFPKVQ